jgi:peptidase E
VERHIIALGGGGFSEEESPVLDDYVVALARRQPPKICFLGTASFDSSHYVDRFTHAFSARGCQPSHLKLLPIARGDPRQALADQDVIYVGGGHTVVMLTVWRRHGLDGYLREAWEDGVVLCGVSAGSMCWFEAGITGVVDPPTISPLTGCLGFLSGSHCPHYDRPERREAYRRMVAERTIPSGYAAESGVALHFRGTDLGRIVSSRPAASAYYVSADGGAVHEEPLAVTDLSARRGPP